MAIDKALYRRVAGSFASGVTVVTTGIPGAYHGMTASAFTSLSLDPTLVLVCVDKEARTFPILQDSGAFNINILAEQQETLSKAFSSRESPESHGLHGVDFDLGEFGLPLIRDALAYLECRVVNEFDAGDHVIFVGEVLRGEVSADSEAGPLLYYRGRYRRLAED